MKQKKLGLIINPIAGLGGSVGLKGTDGVVAEAIQRGAIPQAEVRTQRALTELLNNKNQITIYTGSGALGEKLAKQMGFACVVEKSISDEHTTGKTTQDLVRWLQQQDVDLVLFAGGDGTARDVYAAAQESTVFLGIPAGVKIHSPVYAINPSAAGALTNMYLTGKVTKTSEQEVVDIDENQYRHDIINTKLYGYLTVPMEHAYTQNRKCASPPSEATTMKTIAARVVDDMEPDTYYLIGAGTTTRAIMQELGLAYTLIGVDIVCNKKLVAKDVYGKQIMQYIRGKKAKLVVTITGGQGFLFGRGNQQLTPEVIKKVGKDNLVILATKDKLFQLQGQPLLVDTGDAKLDQKLSGFYRIICSYYETAVGKVTKEN